MTRYAGARGSTNHSDHSVTIYCDAGSHGQWGLGTFFRSEAGWFLSATLHLPDGRRMQRRGDDGAVVLVSPEGRVLTDRINIPEGSHAKYRMRCQRCGDGFPVRFTNMNAALDMLATTGLQHHSLAVLRRAVAAATRQ